MAQTKTLYSLIPKTDIHVGAGSEVAGIIDNLVQRNSTTGLPCIYSSSLKGALKQHVSKNKLSTDLTRQIFGSDVNTNKKKTKDEITDEDSRQGNVAFGQAELLALAVPSDKTMFLLITCNEVLDLFLENLELMGIDNSTITDVIKKIKKEGTVLSANYSNAITPLNEVVGAHIANLNSEEKDILNSLFGNHYEKLAVISNTDFIELASDFYLPVVAHNSIEDGKSENLFYAQNLPMQSVLYFINVYEDDTERDELNKNITANGLVHIGANYSTSIGFCKINKIN